jgi:hypothetical protein
MHQRYCRGRSKIHFSDCFIDSVSLFPTLIFPTAIHFFNKPRFQEVGHCLTSFAQASGETSFALTLDNTSQLCGLLGLLLNIVINALSPPLTCHCFLLDLVRRATETAALLFDFLISKSTNAASIKRAQSLQHVTLTISAILSSEIPCVDAVASLPLRLLRYRLEQGPRDGWDDLDLDLAKVFDTTRTATPSRLDLDGIVDILRAETWGDAGARLRVPSTTVRAYCRTTYQYSQGPCLVVSTPRSHPNRARYYSISPRGELDRSIGNFASPTTLAPRGATTWLHILAYGITGTHAKHYFP